jgi:hypothetical protein
MGVTTYVVPQRWLIPYWIAFSAINKGLLVSREGINIDKLPEYVDERCVGWVGRKQKLLCLMTLDDAAVELSTESPFFRAFIVEDRTTLHISANMRFRDDDHVRWYSVKLKEEEQQKKSRAEKVARIQEGLEQVLTESLRHFANGVPSQNERINCHYPPDDEGDWQKTADWLFEFEPRDVSFKTQSGGAEPK